MNRKIRNNPDILEEINSWSSKEQAEGLFILLLKFLAMAFVVLIPIAYVVAIVGVILHKFGIL